MIAKLTGTVDSTGDGWAVIDVNGVGYLVACSANTLSRLVVGEATALMVETHVREDAIQLFGFVDHGERAWFRMLTTVQGVGAKAALSVLSVLTPENLALAIAGSDKGAITRAAGVGPKLALRIISELRDKVATIGVGSGADRPGAGVLPAVGSDADDAVAALISLGFRPVDAMGAVSRAASRLGADAGVEALIRDGLAHLAPPEQAP